MNILSDSRSIGRRAYLLQICSRRDHWEPPTSPQVALADVVLDLDEYSNKTLEKISVVVRGNYRHLRKRNCKSIRAVCLCVYVIASFQFHLDDGASPGVVCISASARI